MTKKLYGQIIRNLEDIAACIKGLIDEEMAQDPTPVAEKLPDISIDDLRSILAAKSKEGKTAQVKSLLNKYGAENLSGLDTKHYTAVLEEGEKL